MIGSQPKGAAGFCANCAQRGVPEDALSKGLCADRAGHRGRFAGMEIAVSVIAEILSALRKSERA